ncbi:MAG: HEAT repeat domain-containing protein [Thermoguttaceae bacterium]|jgi:HEAT repeat protein
MCRRCGIVAVVAWWVVLAAVRADEPALLGRGLSSWINDLSDSNPETRKKAASVLTVLGPQAKSAVPALTKALADRDPYVRQYSAYALGRIAGNDAAVATALRGLLSDSEWFVRSRAAEAVSHLGPASRAALPDLEPLLKDGQPYVRIAAARALWRIDRRARQALPVLLEAIKGYDDLVVGDAIDGLAAMGEAAAPAEAELRGVLKNSHSELLRKAAARALGGVGPAAREAIPDLLDLLQSRDQDCRLTALSALAKVGAADPRALAALAKMLADPSLGPSAGEELGRAGGVATLVAASRSADSAVKANAVLGLAAVGPDAAPALPALFTALRDDSSKTRKNALAAIGAVGLDDPKFADQLVQALKAERDPGVAYEAGKALRGLEPATIPVLVRFLGDRSIPEDLRRDLFAALAAMRPDAGPAVQELVKAVRDRDDKIRRSALEALAHCDPGVPGTAEALVSLVDNQDQHVFWEVCNTAVKFGPQLRPAVPKLIKFIRDNPRSSGAFKAAEALGWIGVGSKEVVEALRMAAVHEPEAASIALWRVGERDKAMLARVIEKFNRSPSKWLALELGTLGAAAKSAQPALERLLGDGESYNRIAAALALWRIDHANAPRCVAALLRDIDDPAFGGDAMAALGEMGPDARRAIPALAEHLAAKDLTVRVDAARALYRIDRSRAPAIVEVMVRDLSATVWDKPEYAAEMLGEMGADARPAVEALRKRTKDPDPALRRAAIRALRNIEKPAA